MARAVQRSVAFDAGVNAQLAYYVWYAYDEADADAPITLLTFFHDRQRERAPRL